MHELRSRILLYRLFEYVTRVLKNLLVKLIFIQSNSFHKITFFLGYFTACQQYIFLEVCGFEMRVTIIETACH
jgi:hypothetical protein